MTDFDSASTSWSSSCASLGSPTSPAPDAPSRTSSVRSADSSSTGSNGPAAIIAPLAPLASAADDAEPRANWPLSAIAQPQFFQQQQQRPASPPHAVGPPRSPRVRSPTDGVTLFVSNIPLHVTDRSFAALFQQVPGFRSSRVRTDRTRRVIGFVEYVDAASAAQARVLFNNFKFPPPAALVSTSAPGTVIAAACAQHHESGIVVQYANQNSEEQLRELEHLDAQFTLRRTSSESTTDPSGSPDLVGHVVLAGAAPPASHSFSLASQPRRTISDGLPFAERSNSQSAAACVPSNGPPTDPDRLSRLFDTGTVTSTLYVERLPLDATEREVAHIFRPFPGFMSVRVRPTTSKRNPSMRFLLCFVEFDVPRNAAIALDARQGYQLSACDERGLKITFASRAARLNRFAVTQ